MTTSRVVSTVTFLTAPFPAEESSPTGGAGRGGGQQSPFSGGLFSISAAPQLFKEENLL